MFQKGSIFALPALVILVCLILFSYPARAQDQSADPKWEPTLVLPDDTSVTLCEPDSICFPISATDPDDGERLILQLVYPPNNLPPDTFYASSFETEFCFFADTAGIYEFHFTLTDIQNHVVSDSVVYTVVFIPPPVLEDQHFAAEACNLKEDRVLTLSYDNPEGDWVFTLLSGPGTIDPNTGTITYVPDTSGVYEFLVEAANECAADITRA